MGEACECDSASRELDLMAVFGGYENETEEDRQEALASQGRKKQQPQVCLF